MNLFRATAVVLALTTGLLALPAQAQEAMQQNVSGDPLYTANAPDAFSMVADLLIARPLLIGATVIGAAAFVVALPFAATGGGIGAAGRALVVEPGKAAFVRCLGCTGDGYNKRQ
ncbi:multidrug transporter [Pseudomonas sp. LS44]|uniref:multidrug transporter n=1 Tax=Pseudomonas sp. LS44 TaxID=1357074 RepID=UPI00215B1552|nr:multidrug transporter [Pseudomonas sp. LS44]UVE18075.1 multidrug transporter [Pseudomonas sp. LS44]